jgi:hypothetical protein
MNTTQLDTITRELSAFSRWDDLVLSMRAHDYIPTIAGSSPDAERLAEAICCAGFASYRGAARGFQGGVREIDGLVAGLKAASKLTPARVAAQRVAVISRQARREILRAAPPVGSVRSRREAFAVALGMAHSIEALRESHGLTPRDGEAVVFDRCRFGKVTRIGARGAIYGRIWFKSYGAWSAERYLGKS